MSHIFTSFNTNINSPSIINITGFTTSHISLLNTVKSCFHQPHHPNRCTRPHHSINLIKTTTQQDLNHQQSLNYSYNEKWKINTSVKEEPQVSEGGGNDDDDNGNNNKDGGGSGSGGYNPYESFEDENYEMDPVILTVLADSKRAVSSFHGDFASALVAGKVTKEILQRYITMEKNLLMKLLFNIPNLRHRLLADPHFLFKVGVECGIGIFTKTTAEYNKRGKYFWKELDFVIANVFMAIIADFMLVYFPAPKLVYNKKKYKYLIPWFRKCPDNAFQVVQRGMRCYTPTQRLGSLISNGTKLFSVGVLSSFIGVSLINGITNIRRLLDPSFEMAHAPQSIWRTSIGYGVYMSVSSNLRYQVVAGLIEERFIEKVFVSSPIVSKTLTFMARTINTYIGSLLWVDFLRYSGLQKIPVPDEQQLPVPEPISTKSKKGKKSNRRNK